MSYGVGQLDELFGNIASFFFQLSFSILFIVFRLVQACRELKIEFIDWGPKASNKNDFGGFLFVFDDRDNIRTINFQSLIFGGGAIDGFIVLDNSVPNLKIKHFHPQPLAFLDGFLSDDFTLQLFFFCLHPLIISKYGEHILRINGK